MACVPTAYSLLTMHHHSQDRPRTKKSTRCEETRSVRATADGRSPTERTEPQVDSRSNANGGEGERVRRRSLIFVGRTFVIGRRITRGAATLCERWTGNGASVYCSLGGRDTSAVTDERGLKYSVRRSLSLSHLRHLCECCEPVKIPWSKRQVI